MCFDYSCCTAEAGRVHRGELFALFEYISSSLAVVISSAGHGKAELNLCCAVDLQPVCKPALRRLQSASY